MPLPDKLIPLPSAIVPSLSVPMQFPSIKVWLASVGPTTSGSLPIDEAMTLRAPSVVPPIVLPFPAMPM